MVDQEQIVRRVLRNCDISDAGHAGLYSICGLALRLRDLYKWENGLDPWVEKSSEEVLEWIGRKEELWDKLAGRQYVPLPVDGREIDPFDTETINEILAPSGLAYGAGYARGLKPTFFLAVVVEERNVGPIQAVVLGEELARDMLTLPALGQGDRVIFRKESARMYFWDQLFYMKKSGRPFLGYALKRCGIEESDSETLRQHLDGLLERYQDAYIYHEVGEISETDFGREIWREIVGAYPQSVVEYFARTVKDLLADLNDKGTLRRIIDTRDDASLGFYAAFFDGLARSLFPELRIAVDKFTKRGDWDEIEEAVETGRETAVRAKDMLIDFYGEGQRRGDRNWVEKRIEDYINGRGEP